MPVLLLALAACSGSPDVEPVPAVDLDAAQAAACDDLLAALPRSAGGADLSVDGDRLASWGEVRLTCGVAEPEGLVPTSGCEQVQGVGWYVDPDALSDPQADITATAIGFRPRVAVVFPAQTRGDTSLAVLSVLSEPVRGTLERVQRCR